jgi:hypothetical protein
MIPAIGWTKALAIAPLVLLVTGKALAQNTTALVAVRSEAASLSLLERRANLDVEKVELGAALQQVSHGTGVPLLFSPSLLPDTHLTTCRCDKVGEELLSVPFVDADYPARHYRTAEEAVECYREMLPARRDLALEKLRGKDLACWCPILSKGLYSPCHADVLLSIANDIPMEKVIDENTRWAVRSLGRRARRRVEPRGRLLV